MSQEPTRRDGHSKKAPEEPVGVNREPTRKGGPEKSAQPKPPPPLPKSPPHAPPPTFPSRVEQVDPKRRREQKGKDVVETGRLRPTSEEKAQRVAK